MQQIDYNCVTCERKTTWGFIDRARSGLQESPETEPYTLHCFVSIQPAVYLKNVTSERFPAKSREYNTSQSVKLASLLLSASLEKVCKPCWSPWDLFCCQLKMVLSCVLRLCNMIDSCWRVIKCRQQQRDHFPARLFAFLTKSPVVRSRGIYYN